jgi:hypothetical protein
MTNEEQEASAQPPEHDPAMTDTAAVINQLNAAFLERVAETLIDLIAPDCVMEAPVRGPTATSGRGTRNASSAGMGLGLPTPRSSSRSNTSMSTATESSSAAGSRTPQDYRGVNLMRVRDGRIVEALGYGERPQQAVSSRWLVPSATSGEHHVQGLPRT